MLLKGIEKQIEKEFCFTILKKRFTYLVYKHLRQHNWDYLMLVFEGDNPYHSIVAIMFRDERDYFRKFEVPLPILKRDAEKAKEVSDDPLLQVAVEMLEESKNARRVPRTLWGKMKSADIYNLLKN